MDTAQEKQAQSKLPAIAFFLVAPALVFWVSVLLYFLGWKDIFRTLFARIWLGRYGMAVMMTITILLPMAAFLLNAFALREQKDKLGYITKIITTIVIIFIIIYLANEMMRR